MISLSPEMKMQVEIEGDEGAISYYSRSVTLEAVFNRGLKLKRRCHRRHGLGWVTGAGAEHALLAVRCAQGRRRQAHARRLGKGRSAQAVPPLVLPGAAARRQPRKGDGEVVKGVVLRTSRPQTCQSRGQAPRMAKPLLRGCTGRPPRAPAPSDGGEQEEPPPAGAGAGRTG